MLIFPPYGMSGTMAVQKMVCQAKTSISIDLSNHLTTSTGAEIVGKFMTEASL